jgi:hypothetical protein
MQEQPTQQQKFDRPKEDFNQLTDFYEVLHTDLNEGDHFRYTHDKYQEFGRDCKYGVVFEKDENNEIIATSYMAKEGYEPFEVFSTNKYKDFRYYKSNGITKFNILDSETTSTDEIKDILESHQQETTLKTIEELEINKVLYVSNNKYKKTDREIKKMYLFSKNDTSLKVKNSPDSNKSTNIKGECVYKKYLFYQ